MAVENYALASCGSPILANLFAGSYMIMREA